MVERVARVPVRELPGRLYLEAGAVVALDAADVQLGQLAGADGAAAQGGHHRRRDAVAGHVADHEHTLAAAHYLGWALADRAISMVLLLIFFKVYDWIDPRDFVSELATGNTMLGMELEGLFIVLAAVIVGAMGFLGF